MQAIVRVLLMSALALATGPVFSAAPPDPDALVDRMPAPPKSYAEAEKRCGKVSGQGKTSYVTFENDPDMQKLLDEVKKDVDGMADQQKQFMQANMMKLQTTSMDPNTIQNQAQMTAAMFAANQKNQTTQPDQLATQHLDPIHQTAWNDLNGVDKRAVDSGNSWQSKYSDCGKLPSFMETGCEKTVQHKAQSDADDYAKKRTPIVDKYFTDLGPAWTQYVADVHKSLANVKLVVPANVDPNDLHTQIFIMVNQGQRLQMAQSAIEKASNAECPNDLLSDMQKDYGGVCAGEGC